MRKLRRSVLRHTAEKTNAKTIKVFRYLWKKSREKLGDVYAGEIKVKPRKSMFGRVTESLKSKRLSGMSR
jgi:hypothetical protein